MNHGLHIAGSAAVQRFEESVLKPIGKVVDEDYRIGPKTGIRGEKVPDILLIKENIPIEVKKTSTGTSQTRPIQYHTTVVWHESTDSWWVIPAHDLVNFAMSRAGQHCEIQYECMNAGKPTKAWDKWKCRDIRPHVIFQMVVQAWRDSVDRPEERLMAELKRNLAALKLLTEEQLSNSSSSAIMQELPKTPRCF